MPCYATLRYATLRYATLRCAVLCCAVLCCAMLCYAIYIYIYVYIYIYYAPERLLLRRIRYDITDTGTIRRDTTCNTTRRDATRRDLMAMRHRAVVLCRAHPCAHPCAHPSPSASQLEIPLKDSYNQGETLVSCHLSNTLFFKCGEGCSTLSSRCGAP